MNLQSDKPLIYPFIVKFCLFIWLNSLLSLCYGAKPGSPYIEVWELNSLKKIGGHPVQVFGHPEIVKTAKGKAIRFDGTDDRLLVDNNFNFRKLDYPACSRAV